MWAGFGLKGCGWHAVVPSQFGIVGNSSNALEICLWLCMEVPDCRQSNGRGELWRISGAHPRKEGAHGGRGFAGIGITSCRLLPQPGEGRRATGAFGERNQTCLDNRLAVAPYGAEKYSSSQN